MLVLPDVSGGVLVGDVQTVRVSAQSPQLRSRPGGTKQNSIHRKLVGRRLGGSFATDEATPRFMALMNDFCGIFPILGLARESELVLGLAIRDFVDTARIGERKIQWDVRGILEAWVSSEGEMGRISFTHRNHSFVARTRPGR